MVHVCKIVFIDDIVICNLVGDLQAAAGAEGKHHQSFDALEKVTSTIHYLINKRTSKQRVQSIIFIDEYHIIRDSDHTNSTFYFFTPWHW